MKKVIFPKEDPESTVIDYGAITDHHIVVARDKKTSKIKGIIIKNEDEYNLCSAADRDSEYLDHEDYSSIQNLINCNKDKFDFEVVD